MPRCRCAAHPGDSGRGRSPCGSADDRDGVDGGRKRVLAGPCRVLRRLGLGSGLDASATGHRIACRLVRCSRSTPSGLVWTPVRWGAERGAGPCLDGGRRGRPRRSQTDGAGCAAEHRTPPARRQTRRARPEVGAAGAAARRAHQVPQVAGDAPVGQLLHDGVALHPKGVDVDRRHLRPQPAHQSPPGDSRRRSAAPRINEQVQALLQAGDAHARHGPVVGVDQEPTRDWKSSRSSAISSGRGPGDCRQRGSAASLRPNSPIITSCKRPDVKSRTPNDFRKGMGWQLYDGPPAYLAQLDSVRSASPVSRDRHR